MQLLRVLHEFYIKNYWLYTDNIPSSVLSENMPPHYIQVFRALSINSSLTEIKFGLIRVGWTLLLQYNKRKNIFMISTVIAKNSFNNIVILNK